MTIKDYILIKQIETNHYLGIDLRTSCAVEIFKLRRGEAKSEFVGVKNKRKL